MSAQIERAIRRSSEDFVSLVDNEFARELDRRAGIDMWLICRDGHLRGLASRVQWTDDPYNTFTVRIRSRLDRPTEYHKRKAEIAAAGAITPYYFCQAYVSADRTRLITAAIARTADVIAAVDFELGRLMPRNPDGTQGYAITWKRLQAAGAALRLYPGDGDTVKW